MVDDAYWEMIVSIRTRFRCGGMSGGDSPC
jgi:hypothetical protein